MTSFVPAEKSTKASEFDEEITVVLERVSVAASVTVPIPTSNSEVALFVIA